MYVIFPQHSRLGKFWVLEPEVTLGALTLRPLCQQSSWRQDSRRQRREDEP
jgi:hypothetical protein